MGALSALSITGRTLKRNTVLFGVAFAVTLLSLAPAGISAVLPPSSAGTVSFATSVLSFVVTPFFIGGMLAMADEGLDATTRIGTFVDGAKANYVRLLGAMILVGLLFVAIAIVVAIGLAVVAVFTIGVDLAAGSALGGTGNFAVLVLLAAIGGFVTFLPMFFLQFYGPAVVVSDLGPVAALKRSAGLVRRNVVSTLGYTVIAVVVGIVAGIAAVGLMMVTGLGTVDSTGAMSPEVGVGVLAAVAVAAVVVSSVVAAFGTVFQVAFYDELLDSIA